MKQCKQLELIIYTGHESHILHATYYNNRAEIVKRLKGRYIVEHLYEIVAPLIYEKSNYKISLSIDGKRKDLQALENAYYEWIGDY